MKEEIMAHSEVYLELKFKSKLVERYSFILMDRLSFLDVCIGMNLPGRSRDRNIKETPLTARESTSSCPMHVSILG